LIAEQSRVGFDGGTEVWVKDILNLGVSLVFSSPSLITLFFFLFDQLLFLLMKSGFFFYHTSNFEKTFLSCENTDLVQWILCECNLLLNLSLFVVLDNFAGQKSLLQSVRSAFWVQEVWCLKAWVSLK
jgi:hypothetical protein